MITDSELNTIEAESSSPVIIQLVAALRLARERARERRTFALLQAAAQFYPWNFQTHQNRHHAVLLAVDEAECLLSEIERRQS